MGAEFVNEVKYATYHLDENLKITKCDAMFPVVTGYTWEEVKENNMYQKDLIFEEDQLAYFEMVGNNLRAVGEAYIEHRIRRKDGSARFVFCLGQTAFEEGTKKPYYIIRVSDMTKMISMRLQAEEIRKENDEELNTLAEMASMDELTGVLRRGAFVE